MLVSVAVVGATGAVGEIMRQVLDEHAFPFRALKFLASERSAGKILTFKGKTYTVEPIRPEAFAGVDIVLSSTPAGVSRESSPMAAKAGAIVIDNSSAWRMDPEVPLVVPEVNAGAIDGGLLVLVCAEPSDTEAQADKLVAKLLKLRIFSDDAGKMNRSVQDVQGGLLLVSQFTLAADTSGGNRPSFTNAAVPDEGRRLYDYFVSKARDAHPVVQAGEFAADMKVHLVNDGPVTLWLER